MVSKLLKLCFGLVFLANIIHGNFDALEKKLEKMAKKGKKIDKLFVPYENGTIFRSELSLVHKGERVLNHHQVALKFVIMEHKNKAESELEMYTYLNAINNIEVERYGISAIHYCQRWDNYILTVFSFFDGGDLHYLALKGYFKVGNASLAINSLILFRDFILQSKYIHSRGIRHDDIKPANIAVRLARSFLIDFNSASKMMQDNCSGTLPFIARAFYIREVRRPKADWESFLYTMAYINEIELGWLFPGSNLIDDSTVKRMKDDRSEILARIRSAPFASKPLRTVFFEFAQAALEDPNNPNSEFLPPYEHLYEIIVGAIKNVVGPNQTAMFTWLDNDQREAAIRDYGQRINIGGIPDPPSSFDQFEYPEYRLQFLDKSIPKRRSFTFCGSASTR